MAIGTSVPNLSQTPWLAENLAFDQQRIANGSAQGNLTQPEQQVLNTEVQQFESNLAQDNSSGQVTGAERKQLWQEARQINRDIFGLRHNDLGSMGPGGPNAKPPALRGPDHPYCGPNPYLPNGSPGCPPQGGGCPAMQPPPQPPIPYM